MTIGLLIFFFEKLYYLDFSFFLCCCGEIYMLYVVSLVCLCLLNSYILLVDVLAFMQDLDVVDISIYFRK